MRRGLCLHLSLMYCCSIYLPPYNRLWSFIFQSSNSNNFGSRTSSFSSSPVAGDRNMVKSRGKFPTVEESCRTVLRVRELQFVAKWVNVAAYIKKDPSLKKLSWNYSSFCGIQYDFFHTVVTGMAFNHT